MMDKKFKFEQGFICEDDMILSICDVIDLLNEYYEENKLLKLPQNDKQERFRFKWEKGMLSLYDDVTGTKLQNEDIPNTLNFLYNEVRSLTNENTQLKEYIKKEYNKD